MNSWFLKLSLYSAIMNLVFTPFLPAISRIFGYLTIASFFMSVIFTMCRRKKVVIHKTALGMTIAVLISFVTSLHAFQISSIGGLIDDILSVLSFIFFYIALSIDRTSQDILSLDDVFRANNILCVMLLCFAFGPFEFKNEVINEYGGTLFTLGLGNPNGVALYVMFAVVFLIIQIYNVNSKFTRVKNIIVAAALIYVMFLLSSRTVFLCALLIIGAYFLHIPKVFKWLSYFVVLSPIFLFVLQMKIPELDFASVQILGKSIDTGRPELYQKMFAQLAASPMNLPFGNLCNYYFYNAHNGALTILLTLGLSGLVMYLVFWNHQMRLLRNICTDKSQKMAFIALMMVLLHASSESMCVVGTIPFSIFIVVIMKIAKGDIKCKSGKSAKR